MALYKTEAIVLSQRDFGEADRLLTFFSRRFGRMTALAKGVRRPTSRKAGSLEIFNRVDLLLAKGRSLDLVLEVELQNSFSAWRRNLIRVGVAYYFVELVDRLTAEGQPSETVFLLLNRFLGKIKSGSLKLLVREFEQQLLEELGFGVPPRWRSQPGSLSVYIEELLEKKLKSKEVLKKLNHDIRC